MGKQTDSKSGPPQRSDVIAMDAERRMARAQLRSDGAIAKGELSPGNLVGRWKNRQQRRAAAILAQGKAAARNNAPIIGAAAAAGIIFAARKPIMRVLRDYHGARKNK